MKACLFVLSAVQAHINNNNGFLVSAVLVSFLGFFFDRPMSTLFLFGLTEGWFNNLHVLYTASPVAF